MKNTMKYLNTVNRGSLGINQAMQRIENMGFELPRVYRRAICSVIRQRYQVCSDLHRRRVRLRRAACSRLAPAGVGCYTSPPI